MVRYDASLEEEFLKLKQVLVQLSYNPLLQSFEQGNLALLDRTAPVDDFVREKKKLILKHIMRHGVDFDPELKSAYDEYSEALTWIWLKKKVRNIERVPESKIKTPDFKVTVNADQGHQEADQIVYAELKSMSFADGNLNYKQVMQDALDEQIKMDKQRANGNRVSQGVYIISPLYKRNKDYDHSSTRYAIETLIEKIGQNIKKDQYSMGDTVLLIDLKQLVIPTYLTEGGVPVTFDRQMYSLISGVQWHTAFGREGDPIYKQPNFEGSANLDGRLERNGILLDHEYIKAVIFFEYRLSDKEPKFLGLYRSNNITEGVRTFLYQVCDFINDELNSEGWQNNRILFGDQDSK